MAESTPQVPGSDELVEETAVGNLLGADPWMRFDIWSGRVWECASEARDMAKAGIEGPSESIIGHPVHAAFTAAQFAQEIAEMVNPLSVISRDKLPSPSPSTGSAQAILAMLIDDGEQD